MERTRYIDHEPVGLSEYDFLVQDGGSTFQRALAAGWPLRGAAGARCATVVDSLAYGQVTDCGLAIALNETGCLSFWMYLRAAPVGGLTGIIVVTNLLQSSLFQMRINIFGKLYLIGYFDAGGQPSIYSDCLLGRWHHVVIEVKRAVAGWIKWYLDGILVHTLNGDNTGKADAIKRLRLGSFVYGRADYVCDFDEVVVGRTRRDVAPYRPFRQGAVIAAPQGAVVAGASAGHLLLRK